MKEKRILFLAPQPFYMERGSSFRTLATVSTLADLGFKVDVISFAGGEKLAIDGVRMFHTPPLLFFRGEIPVGFSYLKLFHDLMLFFLALSHLLRRRYVAIHAVEESTLFAPLLSFLFRLPYVADAYSDVALHLKRLKEGSHIKNVAARLLLTSLSGASGVISNSSNHSQFSENQTTCNINGLPLTLYRKPTALQLAKTGRKFQLTRRRVVLYTGTFAANDGVEVLLRAFALLLESQQLSHAERAGLYLVLAGSARRRDPIRRYRRLAIHLGIEHRVLFTGRSAGEHFSSLVAWADTVVCPKLEGDDPSIKLYSYLSARKKVVASNIPAHTKVITSDTAFLADPTIESFAEALRQTLSTHPEDLAHQARICSNAQAKVEEIFKAGLFRDQLARLYAEVLPTDQTGRLPERSALKRRKGSGEFLHQVQFSARIRTFFARRIPKKLKKFGSCATLSIEQLQQEYSLFILCGLEELKILL